MDSGPTPAIRAEALSKCYHLYAQPADRLRQLLWRGKRNYYREFWALHETTFEVPRGEVLGLVGRNGAGKSTLLQLVCGTLTPSRGSVAVNGRVAALLELGAGFNQEFSGRENVFLAASIMGLSTREIEKRFDEIVDFSGIRDFIEQPVKTYSSGMYVRLAFSVATSVDPDILVIDEALSVGDGEFARKSFDRIMTMKKTGVTILFCSHSLYHIEAFCDRVLWLEHGRPMMLGEPQEVVRRYTSFLLGGEATAQEAKSETAIEVTQAKTDLADTPALQVKSEVIAPHPPEQPAASITGFARFTRVEVALDGKPGRELLARSGENTLTVTMQFASDPSLPTPVVAATLDYGSLLAVTCAVSRSDGVKIERDALGRGEATLTFPRLALRKGEYRIGVYLGCENALHMYDSAMGVATLTVKDHLPEPGLVSLPHAWRTLPGHSRTGAALPATTTADRRRVELADGRVLWVDAADSLGIAANRIFEPQESKLCVSLLRPGDRVLDIGANLGYYTTLCAERVSPTGRVDAIEPDPDNFALLDANTRELQARGPVRLHALALSDRSGSARLFHSKDNSGMHRLYQSVCCEGPGIEVPARCGDELGLAPLDLIKIDVEGFEPYALRGLATTLAQSPHVKILCEYSPLAMLEAGADPGTWLKWMNDQGFRARAFDGNGWNEAACADLEEQAGRLARIDIASLAASLRPANSPTIAAAAAAAAADQGYTRPIVENLLFVRASIESGLRKQSFAESRAQVNSPAKLSEIASPLNIYAHALELEEGRAEDLHYGLFETPDMPASEAQRRSTELLLRHLPPPCRLLEVGLGFGTTLTRLVAAGYAATGITPDRAQVNIARARHGDTLPAICIRLEDFGDNPGGWDALLFQESAQYIDPLHLFTRANDLLGERGEMIILDEFALRRAAPGPEHLHLLQHFIALAERFGFAVTEKLDLSREAAPTLDYLLRVVTRHGAALQRDLGITEQALAALNSSNAAYREKYADGRYGYFLLKLRRIQRPRWRVGFIDRGNADVMRELFAEVFHHRMSDAHWFWKYGEGRGTAIGVWEGERLIAHYGGIARSISYFGEPQSAAQSCDVMVASRGRATLSRQGPLFLAAATYLENQLGYGNPHLLGFGFPNVRAWKAPARLGLYGGPVGRMLELSWPAARGRPSPLVAVRALDLTKADNRADADACWAAMRADLHGMIAGARDAETLHHRYTAHPNKVYRMFVVRHRVFGHPLGLFVLRPDAEEGCELLDVVAPLAAVPRVVAQARRAAASLGASRLFGWVVDNIRPHFGPHATVHDLEVNVPANAWTAGPPIENLVGKWWLTGGDTDFH